MTILNNDLLGNYVSITPIKVTFTDQFEANALTAEIINDNLKDSAVIKFNLYYFISTKDWDKPSNYAQLMKSDTIVIANDDYANWTGTNEYVYEFIGNNLPINLL